MELIDKLALKADIKKRVTQYRHGDKPMPTIEDIINEQSAIDAEPVRHGYWIQTGKERPGAPESIRCSECGFWYIKLTPRFYCSNCGAKMDEVE